MDKERIVQRIGRGAAAGLIGTAGKVAWSLARHVLFGIATVSAYRRLKRSLA